MGERWASPQRDAYRRGKRHWRLARLALVLCIASFLCFEFLGLQLVDFSMFSRSVLRGAHPYHFPVYFEHIASLNDAVTPFERTVMRQWRSRHEMDGVFNYKIGSAKEPLLCRELGDSLGMVVQAALGRAGKRSSNRTRIVSVRTPIPKGAFTFRRAAGKEVLATFSDVSGVVPVNLPQEVKVGVSGLPEDDNLVIVNTNPFGAFHFLLVPMWGHSLPQVLTLQSLRLALRYSSQSSAHLKLTFNSIGAGSSINNQHWQGFYLLHPLPIERAPQVVHFSRKHVEVHEVQGWPIRCYAITAASQEILADVVFRIVEELLEMNVAHNLLVTDGGQRVFVIPRTIGWFPDVTRKQIAAMEVVGFWVIPNMREFNELTAHDAHEFLRTARPDRDVDVTECAQSVLRRASLP
eukprot:TRINITY_DN1593_c0_g1_i1.p1 TRINITY_DN1593_c0_g1~~TRINITY_DN1593_c0_g1_i1.p1  ORF type:complete len:407 (+),score=112.84 TRINITY_DN1593_c0_g1_i1:159-1379(+)